jgi:hypothetical protein
MCSKSWMLEVGNCLSSVDSRNSMSFLRRPQEEYEGEYMVHTGDYVQILGRNKAPTGETNYWRWLVC